MAGKFLCHTPFDVCSGGTITFDAKSKGLKAHKLKAHASGAEANTCYGRYLLSQGYTRINAREYAKAGEPTQILRRATREPDLRDGKSWKGAGRVMPAKRTSGVIVG